MNSSLAVAITSPKPSGEELLRHSISSIAMAPLKAMAAVTPRRAPTPKSKARATPKGKAKASSACREATPKAKCPAMPGAMPQAKPQAKPQAVLANHEPMVPVMPLVPPETEPLVLPVGAGQSVGTRRFKGGNLVTRKASSRISSKVRFMVQQSAQPMIRSGHDVCCGMCWFSLSVACRLCKLKSVCTCWLMCQCECECKGGSGCGSPLLHALAGLVCDCLDGWVCVACECVCVCVCSW